jgi:hypothetical protein
MILLRNIWVFRINEETDDFTKKQVFRINEETDDFTKKQVFRINEETYYFSKKHLSIQDKWSNNDFTKKHLRIICFFIYPEYSNVS